eukprot:5698132-Pyramimonas_sp.AAC.1
MSSLVPGQVQHIPGTRSSPAYFSHSFQQTETGHTRAFTVQDTSLRTSQGTSSTFQSRSVERMQCEVKP